MTPDKFAALVLVRFAALAAALAASGWPGITQWWNGLLESFMRSGVPQLVARVGRRGFKSSTACVFAVAFALVYSTLGLVPPGDIGWVVFVSVTRDEAQSRLRTVSRILEVIGVRYALAGDTLIIDGTNIGFRVQACTVASVSGWTTILIIADEVAKWMDRDTGANCATEVLAALRPTMSTQPLARILLLSSPLSVDDAHARAFDAGSSSFQLVTHAETWVASAGFVSEEQTHRLEPDTRTWAREYAAIPSAAINSAFDPEFVDRSFAMPIPETNIGWGTPIIAMDPSSGKNDEFAWAVVRWILPASITYRMAKRYVGGTIGWIWDYDLDREGRRIELEPHEIFKPRLHIGEIHGIRGNFSNSISADFIVNRIANDARAVGASQIISDQRESYSLESLFAQKGLRFAPIVWSAPSKAKFVEHARMLMRERKMSFAADPVLRTQLLQYEERITASGTFIYSGRGQRSDDRAALTLTACGADLAGLVPSSPHGPRPVYRNLSNLPSY
jgi:hypothetical protein